jgi:dethiobiotin synthetase
MPTIVVTGIDTDIGKTIATGLLARYVRQMGVSVITQKIVQTGCADISDDIRLHRQLMGIDLTPEDHAGVTCPYLFPLPASPHLAAREARTIIEPDVIITATRQLEQVYDLVLLEGVGGVYVPLNDSLTLLDYLEKQRYPVIVVSSSRLGSINHTLLTLDAVRQRQLDVLGIIYNLDPTTRPEIADDSKHVFSNFLRRFGFRDVVIPLPYVDIQNAMVEIDFMPLVQTGFSET